MTNVFERALALLLSCSLVAFAAAAEASPCTVTIQAPQANVDVPSSVVVSGIATAATSVSVRYKFGEGAASRYVSASGTNAWSLTLPELPLDATQIIARGTNAEGSCWHTIDVSRVVLPSQLSSLFGFNGESWHRDRLPDFSFAGYHQSNDLSETSDGIPSTLGTGATFRMGASSAYANGEAFTTALQSAINATNAQGAPRYNIVLIPAGTFELTRVINIDRSKLILRGASRDGTTLVIQKSLSDLTPQNLDDAGNVLSCDEMRRRTQDPSVPVEDKPVFYYSRGGFIQYNKQTPKSIKLSYLSADGLRGSRVLRVTNFYPYDPARQPVAGMEVVLRADDEVEGPHMNWLYQELFMGQAADEQFTPERDTRLEWPVRVEAISAGDVTLSRALPWSVLAHEDPEGQAQPRLIAYPTALSEVGLENMTIAFPAAPGHPEHHCETGYNAIDYNSDVRDAWVRNVHVKNADNGILVGYRSSHLTFRELVFSSKRAPNTELPGRKRYGHHGIIFNKAYDSYVTEVVFINDMIHDVGVGHLAAGNVFSNISMEPSTTPGVVSVLDLDHHGNAPSENLFTNIHSLASFQDSGNVSWGPASAARSTFWNIGATLGGVVAHYESPPWGHVQTNWVGDLRVDRSDASSPLRVAPTQSDVAEYYEHVPALYPDDLFKAQLNLRRNLPPQQ